MWHTPKGTRKIVGAERDLLANSVMDMVFWAREDEEDGMDNCTITYGHSEFDGIPFDERRYVLLSVLYDMLSKKRVPELYAWNEATVATIFDNAKERIHEEINFQKGDPKDTPLTQFRGLALKLYEKTNQKEDSEYDQKYKNIKPTSTDKEVWDFIIEGAYENILHDNDFDMVEMLDIGQTKANEIKKHMGIANDYYSEGHPVFSEAEKKRLDKFERAISKKVEQAVEK